MPPFNELAKAIRFVDLATREVERAPFTRAMAGETFDRLPVHDEADAERQATVGGELVRLGQEIDVRALPVERVTMV